MASIWVRRCRNALVSDVSVTVSDVIRLLVLDVTCLRVLTGGNCSCTIHLPKVTDLGVPRSSLSEGRGMGDEPGRESSRIYRAAYRVGEVLAVPLLLAVLAGIGYGVWFLVAGGGSGRTPTAATLTPRIALPAHASSSAHATSQATAPAPIPVTNSSSKAAAWSFDPARLASPGDPDWSQWCQAYYSVAGNTMTVIIDRMNRSVTEAAVTASLHRLGVTHRHVTSFPSDIGTVSFGHGRAAETLAVVVYAHQAPHACRVGKWNG
jgi:hypothetical protein